MCVRGHATHLPLTQAEYSNLLKFALQNRSFMVRSTTTKATTMKDEKPKLPTPPESKQGRPGGENNDVAESLDTPPPSPGKHVSMKESQTRISNCKSQMPNIILILIAF